MCHPEDNTRVRGFCRGELVTMSAKKSDDWPTHCEKCGSENIRVVYGEAAGVKRASYSECLDCQDETFRSNTCPDCYARMNFEGTRGGIYMLHKVPGTPGVFRCPHCKSTFVKKNNLPVRVVLED